ncbi:MAG: bifunctional diguanylate cyclase/phosphodiesterase [Sphaerochaetaceae bacterium]
MLTGPLVALLVSVVILVDLSKERFFRQSEKNKLFKDFTTATVIVHLVALLIAFNGHLFCSPLYTLLLVIYNLLLVVTLYLWLLYILAEAFEGVLRVSLISKHMRVFTVLIVLATALTFPFKGFSVRLVALHILPVFTLIWLITLYALLYSKRKQIISSQKYLLLFIPLLLTVGIGLYLLSALGIFVTLAFTFALLTTYLSTLNLRLTIDPLTETKERRLFVKELRKLLDYKRGEQTVIISDIVQFKYFNQKYGITNGDLLLRQIGAFFSSLVGKENVFRYGGDQFALIYEAHSEEDLNRLLTTINQRFASAWSISGACLKVAIKVALLKFSEEKLNGEAMIDAIDLTLSKAKENKLSNITYYSSAISQRYERQLGIEAALNHALENKTVKVVYQPIINALSGEVEALEALARIDDFHIGPISPVEFIPVAESTGLINEITFEVLKQVCQLSSTLDRSHKSLKNIAINLSPSNLLLPNFEKRALALINLHQVATSKICFELTESLLIHSYDRVKSAMDYLASKGISFALDDFGKGFSNLESLVLLPFSTVKIDRSIIQASQKDFTYLSSIILMLKKMGKKIVAEGIETAELAELLTKAGAEALQGFYFSRPLPPQKVKEFLERQHNG